MKCILCGDYDLMKFDRGFACYGCTAWFELNVPVSGEPELWVGNIKINFQYEKPVEELNNGE